MNLYTVLALALLAYFVRDMMRTWVSKRAEMQEPAERALQNDIEQLRASVEQLESNLSDAHVTNERLTERIQHLETIVTHEAWDRFAEDGPSIDPPVSDNNTSEASKASDIAAQWARRLRG